MLQHRIPLLLVLVSITAIGLSCSTNSPVVPSVNPITQASGTDSSGHGRSLWGIWEMRVDLQNGTIDALPLRTADLHFNVIPLLKEGTPKSSLKFSGLLIDSSAHTLQVDISLTHPFPTLPQVAGFDVHGTLFTRGGLFELDIAQNGVMTGPDEPRLINADGYTRWWNPKEFTMNNVFGYRDGYYGTNKANGNYKITVAGYKYFADSLNALDTMDDLDTGDRGVFRAGSTNKRRYLIDFGSDNSNWVIFNYAVDANWGLIPGFVPGGAPPDVPDDFPLTANSTEPYRIRVSETSNTLSATTAGGTSGTVAINIDIFDWQAMDPISSVPMEVSVVMVEAPIFNTGPVTATVIYGSGGSGNMSTYQASITGSYSDKLDTIDIVVVAESTLDNYQKIYTNFVGDYPTQAFQVYQAQVADDDTYSGWTYRYSRALYNEIPNQGANNPDLAVYKKSGTIRAATMDQVNPDPNGEGNHAPDSVNEWSNDYKTRSMPEHYHMPLGKLIGTGLWNDINNFSVSDSSTRLMFTTTNTHDEYSDGESDPLYAYLNWVSHTYLGNLPAEAQNTVFFSAGAYPRYFATDPCNGVNVGTDFMYNIFLYDVTGLAGGNPGVDPQRYIIFRWKPPYMPVEADADWQRALNVPPNGNGVGYIDRNKPQNHRLGVDDSGARTRFYMLDSRQEIEVVDCDFTKDEFSGSFPIGTVTVENRPAGVTGIIDLEVVQTKSLGTTRNHVAALCVYNNTKWVVWVFDYDQTQAINAQAVTIWMSDPFNGTPYSLDAADAPVEVHVLSRAGGFVYANVFRNYP